MKLYCVQRFVVDAISSERSYYFVLKPVSTETDGVAYVMHAPDMDMFEATAWEMRIYERYEDARAFLDRVAENPRTRVYDAIAEESGK